jgi:starch synthase
VVHETGGLADTVTGANEETLASGSATGFSFQSYTQAALAQTLEAALSLYRDHPELWQQMVTVAMQQDWSWQQSAARYLALYRQTIARHQATVLTT